MEVYILMAELPCGKTLLALGWFTYNSWTLNDDSCLWVPPIVRPDDTDVDKKYIWDEDVYQGDNTKGWVEVEIV
jgi:hypothetical protein